MDRASKDDPSVDPAFVIRMDEIRSYVDERPHEPIRDWMKDIIAAGIAGLAKGEEELDAEDDSDDLDSEGEESEDAPTPADASTTTIPLAPSTRVATKSKRKASGPSVSTEPADKRAKVDKAKPKKTVNLTINTSRPQQQQQQQSLAPQAQPSRPAPHPERSIHQHTTAHPDPRHSLPTHAGHGPSHPTHESPDGRQDSLDQQHPKPVPRTIYSIPSRHHIHPPPHELAYAPEAMQGEEPYQASSFPSHQPYYTEEVRVRKVYSPMTPRYPLPNLQRSSHPSPSRRRLLDPSRGHHYEQESYPQQPSYQLPPPPPADAHNRPAPPTNIQAPRPRHLSGPALASSSHPHPDYHPRSLSSSHAYVPEGDRATYSFVQRPHHQQQPSPQYQHHYTPADDDHVYVVPSYLHSSPPQHPPAHSPPSYTKATSGLSPESQAGALTAFYAKQERFRLEKEELRREAEALGLEYLE